jgi:hypothetical protein
MQSIGCVGWVLIGLLLAGVVAMLQSVEGVILALLLAGGLGFAIYAGRKSSQRRKLAGYRDVLNQLRRLELDLSGVAKPWLTVEAGEVVIAELDRVELREYKSSGATTSGGFGGAGFQLSKNVSIFGGGGKGQVTNNPETSTVLDVGRVAFSNRRVVFVGPNQNREWRLDKLLTLEVSEGGDEVQIASSERERVSALHGDIAAGGATGFYFAIAEAMHKSSDSEVKAFVSSLAEDLETQIAEVQTQFNL